jgi:putative sterol carrier protein
MATYETKEAMEQVLVRMFDLMKNDDKMREGTKKTRLSVGHEITDLDLTFVLTFDHGQCRGELGGAPDDADIQLSLTSEAYDRLFTGQLNATRAAVSGELAFSGNVASAMGLQGLLPETIRVYKAAKA